MAEDDAVRKLRDQRLDELKKAKDELLSRQQKAIEAEVRYLRSLKLRGTATSLARANAQVSKLLLIQDISTFLS